MNMISSFLHPEDAYKKAQIENDRAWNEAQGYGKPYWQAGVDQTGKLTGAQDRLMNPGQLQNEWAQGYETSPYARQLLEHNQGAGLDAASSMGLNGSSAAAANIQQGAGNIVAQDRQQYMNDLMQKYLAGIGIGQNIYGEGAGMGKNLMAGAMDHGNKAAQYAYGRQAAPGAMFGRLTGISTGAATGGGNFNG